MADLGQLSEILKCTLDTDNTKRKQGSFCNLLFLLILTV